MKKLMFAASAALCATVGFSDVTSANVVGYQTKEIASDNFTMLNIPFYHVNNDGKGLMLNSDITVNQADGKDNPGTADQIWVWVPSKENYDKFFLYDDGDPDNFGWSAIEDDEWCFIQDYPGYENGLPEGAAIYYKARSKTGKTMTGSGQVENESECGLDIAPNNFTMLGNPYPTALQLNDKLQFAVTLADGDDNPGTADQIWVWIPSKDNYDKFFLYDDGDKANFGWSAIEDDEWCFIQDYPGYENGIPVGTPVYYKSRGSVTKEAVYKKTF